MNKIFHPNIDELYVIILLDSINVCFSFRSGSVCLDVINQTWSPMFGICFLVCRDIFRHSNESPLYLQI